MKPPAVKLYSIRKLRSLLDRGIFAIPRLQREFVWKGSQAAALLDSIYRSMPVGSLIVWSTPRRNRDLLRSALHILPPFNPSNSHIWFLVDGQQRLSVVHQAFQGETKRTSGGREIDFTRLCYRISKDGGDSEDQEQQSDSFAFRIPMDREWVSMRNVLSPHWKRIFSALPKHLQVRIGTCRSRVLSYQLPLVFVEGNNLEEVRELFIRINTQGMRIGSADRAFARASDLDLRERAQLLRDELPLAFRAIPHETILQAFALVEGSTDVGERAYDSIIRSWTRRIKGHRQELKKFYKRWGELRRAFGQAVEYITNFAVFSGDVIPSNNMLATLAVFFFYHRGQPSGQQRKEIAKWFWATGVGQRYSGRGYRDNILTDARFFKRLAMNGSARFSVSELADRGDLSRAEYRRRSALTDSYFCLLAARGPRFVTNGQLIPPAMYASRASRRHQHHIFPRALLSRSGFGAREFNSLPNICLVVAQENQHFGSKRPSVYLKEYRKRRFFRRAMTSHLVPVKADSGLWLKSVPKGFRAFRRQRLEIICKAFEREAGIRLFRPI